MVFKLCFSQVVGTDPHGFEFRRTTQTAISAERAVKPITFMIPSIKATVENEIIVINCQIYSLVPFSVRWIKDTQVLGPSQNFQYVFFLFFPFCLNHQNFYTLQKALFANIIVYPIFLPKNNV